MPKLCQRILFNFAFIFLVCEINCGCAVINCMRLNKYRLHRRHLLHKERNRFYQNSESRQRQSMCLNCILMRLCLKSVSYPVRATQAATEISEGLLHRRRTGSEYALARGHSADSHPLRGAEVPRHDRCLFISTIKLTLPSSSCGPE